MLSFLRRLFNREGQTPGGWDDDLDWLYPPKNVHDVDGWNQYWKDQVSNGLGPQIFDMFTNDQVLVEYMDRLGLQTVLCVGNGISLEPRSLMRGLKSPRWTPRPLQRSLSRNAIPHQLISITSLIAQWDEQAEAWNFWSGIF